MKYFNGLMGISLLVAAGITANELGNVSAWLVMGAAFVAGLSVSSAVADHLIVGPLFEIVRKRLSEDGESP